MESTVSGFRTERVGAHLGAEVSEIDLTQPLDEKTVSGLTQAHSEYELLVFRNQNVTPAQLMAFGRSFGELSVHPFSTNSADNPELIVYDNNKDNPPFGTDVWHTDETFRETPPMGTVLRAVESPKIGGDTLFVSMSAAYDGLSDRMQSFLSGLEAVHDFKPFRLLFPQDKEGREKVRQYEDLYPPVTHPVVRLHPVTDKKILFVNPQFTLGIKGMQDVESRALLSQLYSQASVPEYQYRHRWEPHTIVFWDNRSTQHYAVHDYYPQRRLMHRVTVKDDIRPVGATDASDESEVRSKKSVRPELGQRGSGGPRRQFQRDKS